MEYSFLLPIILEQYPLDPLGIHGLFHWARVAENGLRLAVNTGADPRIVELFAWFHDARRVNDGTDPDHGVRGAEFARDVCGQRGILSAAAVDTLHYACSNHSQLVGAADITSQTCWDADRLDMARTGMLPDPAFLGTAAARAPAMIDWAISRSQSTRAPLVLESMMRLYHASPVGQLELLTPHRRFTPGSDHESRPAIYASDHPAYAAAHAFTWSTSDGVQLFFDGPKPVLIVPERLRERLLRPAYVYSVPYSSFELLHGVPPFGRNFRSYASIVPLGVDAFDTVVDAVEGLGGTVVVGARA
jgi:uncharacterized protein